MAQLEIKNLSFSYPVEEDGTEKLALDSVSLSVDSGEFLLICGPSGCGKSTLLRQLKPSLSPHGKLSGEVLMEASPIASVDFKTQSRDIGFVMQDPEMQIVTDKVWHELAFGLENLGTKNHVMRIRIAEIASYFGLQNILDRKVCELSGGQKQLVCLAAVMAMQPKIVLLDEPTSQLDPIAASEFFSTLKRINEELGTTIIITEHRYENLFPIVDRVAFMQEGRLICCCEPRNALEELQSHWHFLRVLPTSMRVFSKASEGEYGLYNAPLTVREGREYLISKMRDFNIAGSSVEAVKTKKHSQNIKTGKPIIEASELWYRYERNSDDILKSMSFNIYKGELTCIIGGNGAGKTTALMVAAGLFRPYRGKVLYNGKDISKIAKNEFYGRKIAVLVQNPQCCFVKDTVREELNATIKNFALTNERLNEVISIMEIDDILDSHPYDISGGELQRAAIAKLLLPSPEVLFLDEATKGMDAFFKEKFGRLLKKLTESGVSIVLVSHDIEFCAEFADRMAMFFDGAITAEGTAREVLLNNSFYTTVANRLSRGIMKPSLTVDEIISGLNIKGQCMRENV